MICGHGSRSAGITQLPLDVFRDEQDALDQIHSASFALGASIFSRDITRARALAARIKNGFVLINDLIVPTADPRMPFGGVKASGFGSTRGNEGLLEMTFPHVVAVRRGNSHRHFDETGADDARLFSSYIRAAHGRGRAALRRDCRSCPRTDRRNQTEKDKIMKPIGIIGGGLGGLSAACVLAARGHKVILFERNDWLGGKAAQLRGDGFRFDMGPTIVTIPSVLRRIFSEAGARLEDYLELVRLDPQWRCFFDDGAVLDLAQDPERNGADARSPSRRTRTPERATAISSPTASA